jgi:hypothetical protein
MDSRGRPNKIEENTQIGTSMKLKEVPVRARKGSRKIEEDRGRSTQVEERIRELYIVARHQQVTKGKRSRECPTPGAAQPDPLNRIDYDVLTKFGSSYKLASHVDTSLQLFHALEKNLN